MEFETRLLDIDAAEAGNRADAVDALVPIANDSQVMALASHIRRLEHDSGRFMLHIEVVREDHAVAEVRIDGVDCRPGRGRRGEWVGQADVGGVVHGRGKWRVGAQAQHDIGGRLIVIDTESAANHGLAAAERIVRKPDARPEIRELLPVRLRPVHADLDQRIARKIVDREPIVLLVGDAVILPAQAQVQRQPGRDLVIVLDERPERVHVERRRGRPGCLRGLSRGTGQERGQCPECQHAAGAAVEIVVGETPELAAHADGVLAADPADGVAVLIGGVAAPLRSSGDAPEGQRSRNRDIREHRRGGCDTERGRIFGEDRVERNPQPVETGAQFVGQARRENPGVAEREEVPPRRPLIAESRQVVALQRRLGAGFVVDNERPVYEVLGRPVVVDAAGPLVLAAIARGGPDKERSRGIVRGGRCAARRSAPGF